MKQTTQVADQLIDDIADALAQQGFIQLQDFLPESLANSLLDEAKSLAASAFKPAGIGRHSKAQKNTQIRSDSTLWLNGDSAPQKLYLDWMQQLKIGLNRRLFMGLNEFECHYSHYSKGDFYQRHLDAFKSDVSTTSSNRMLSSVYYLNQNWDNNDGGELLIYQDQQTSPLLKVSPVFNRCVMFLSNTFPHEVLASQCDRFSIAGWFRS